MLHSTFIRFVTLILAAAIGMGLHGGARAASDLDRAYRIIAGKKFVDLTHSFAPDTPVWSGFGQAKMTPAADPKTREPYAIPKDGFRTTSYEMVGQYGTHVDPPAHFAPNGITMDNIPLKQMILPLVVLDVTPYLGKDQNHAFAVRDLLIPLPRIAAVVANSELDRGQLFERLCVGFCPGDGVGQREAGFAARTAHPDQRETCHRWGRDAHPGSFQKRETIPSEVFAGKFLSGNPRADTEFGHAGFPGWPGSR